MKLYNIQAEMKKLRDTGDYSKNELARREAEMKQHNEEEREQRKHEQFTNLGPYRNPKTGGFLHYEMARDIIDQYDFCTINNTLYIWWDGKYTPEVQDKINLIGIKLDPTTIKTNRTEVYNTIVGFKSTFRAFAQVDPYKIAFMNGVLDLSTLEFYTEDLEQFAVCNRIPWNYNDDPEDQPQVKEQIKKWADYDDNIEKLLYQLIGYPMLINCNLRTMFLLHGSAQGGKTKFVEYIEYLYGNENYATFDIEEVNKRFNKAQICGKLFNYSDDIDAGYIDKPNFLKRLISGMTSMQVENKGKDGYKAPFYAKLIMSMNEFPKMKMDSDVTAWASRLNIIHFKHKFEKNPCYNQWEQENLKTKEAVEWLLQQSALAIHDAIETGDFCYNDITQFDNFLQNNAPFMHEALSLSLKDWEQQGVKGWFDINSKEFGSQISFKAFMSQFNKLSNNIEIYRTTEPLGHKRVTKYKARQK